MFDFGNPGDSWIVRAHRLRRSILRSDRRLREDYLSNAADPKLQIGGGWHRLNGWLNTDLDFVPDVMLMDATKPFPFGDETFQYVFTEHMIEHLPYAAGAQVLRECYRVLRRGGAIRITTPDLTAIAGLVAPNRSEVQQAYLDWFCKTFVSEERASPVASTINSHFRLWGHQFIYDEATLRNALYETGFTSVKRSALNESDDPALRDLENTERYPAGLLDFESMALEARK